MFLRPTEHRYVAGSSPLGRPSGGLAGAREMSRSGDFPPIRRYRSRNSLTRSSLVGRPPRTSRRNGPTSSSELGPPTAVNRTAVRSSSEILDTTASSSPPGRFVDEPHQRSQLVLRRLRQDSVA